MQNGGGGLEFDIQHLELISNTTIYLDIPAVA